jgi:KDO2-lipid IV(A) lauroyltransferase
MPRARRVSLRNLELVFPEGTAEWRKQTSERSFQILAENLLGFAKIPLLTPDRAKQMFDFESLQRQLAAIRPNDPSVGVLYLAAHFGPFEYIVQLCILASRPATILARGFGYPKLDAWWNSRREKFGAKVFSRKGAYRETIDRLSTGQDVVMLCDQNVKRNHAVFARFFGIPAATTKTPALAAMRTGAPVCLVVGYRQPDGRYGFYLRRLPDPSSLPGTNDEKVAGFTEAMHRALEEVITEHPEQWFWLHRRFKTRPVGEAETLYA